MQQMSMNFEAIPSPKKRQFRQTSKDAHDSIKESKEAIHKKIVEALRKIKVGGTFHEIAVTAKLTDAQTWKRISEIENIYDSGLRRKLPSGRNGIVWQLKEI